MKQQVDTALVEVSSPTCNFRWLIKFDGIVGKKILQQAWVSNTGNVEWKEIETVEETDDN